MILNQQILISFLEFEKQNGKGNKMITKWLSVGGEQLSLLGIVGQLKEVKELKEL